MDCLIVVVYIGLLVNCFYMLIRFADRGDPRFARYIDYVCDEYRIDFD